MRMLLLLLVPAASLAEPLRVFASVVPVQTFIKKIGGQQVDARAMVRPGFNPHHTIPRRGRSVHRLGRRRTCVPACRSKRPGWRGSARPTRIWR